eukprot:1138980-Lingulodinium_polyedra.AAC.1
MVPLHAPPSFSSTWEGTTKSFPMRFPGRRVVAASSGGGSYSGEGQIRKVKNANVDLEDMQGRGKVLKFGHVNQLNCSMA